MTSDRITKLDLAKYTSLIQISHERQIIQAISLLLCMLYYFLRLNVIHHAHKYSLCYAILDQENVVTSNC